jgi:Cd2+/Zn2+-exporting ATPase
MEFFAINFRVACKITDIEEVAGQGVRANVGGRLVCVGNEKMMEAVGAAWHKCHHVGTIIHVAVDGKYVGHIVIDDHIKDDSIEAVSALRKHNGALNTHLTQCAYSLG